MNKIKEAALVIFKNKNTHVLTGAGISVDSGIPDFRSAGGIWDRYDPEIYAHINAFKKDPVKLWDFFKAISSEFDGAKPNVGHIALAEMEKMGYIHSIATQNIDHLHTLAGSQKVYYLHGNNSALVCIKCRRKYDYHQPFQTKNQIPYCECGRVLKPDIIMFGETLPLEILQKAEKAAATSKVYMVAGTSAVVMPAAMLPHTAKSYGAVVIEINLEDTPLTHSITDIQLKGSTTEILPALSAEIKALAGS